MRIKKILSVFLTFSISFVLWPNAFGIASGSEETAVYFDQNEGCGGYEIGAYDKSAVQPTAFNWTRQSQFKVGNNPSIKWTLNGGGKDDSDELIGITIGNDGTIYSPGTDGLKAVSSDGKLKWTSKEGAFSAPAIAEDGTIYVSGEYHNFNAINPDGSTKWTFHNKDKYGYYHFNNAAIASDGTIITACSDGWISGINGDGTEKWSFFTSYPNGGVSDYAAPAIDSKGVAWIRLKGGLVQGINKSGADAGSEWGGYWGEAALSKDYDDYFIFVDKRHESDGQPAIAKDGTKYVNSGGALIAYSSKGPIKWTYDPSKDDNLQVKASNYGFSSPIIDANGIIYFSSGNRVYAISPDGNKIWSIDLKSTIYSSPAIGSDGTLYFADSDNLYAIGGGVPQDVKRKAAENVNRPLQNQTGINPYSREDILKGTPGIINGTDNLWKQNTVLGQRGGYPFAGIYEFNNLTIDDNVEVTSAGISQLVIKVKGTLTLGKNASIRVRNGYYSEAPKYKISSLTDSDLNTLGFDAGGFRVYPYMYGKGGDGANGKNGGDRTEQMKTSREVTPGYDPITQSKHKSHLETTNAGDGGGGGGYGGGKGGKGSYGGKGGGTNGKDGNDNGGNGGLLANSVSTYNTGNGGGDIYLGSNAIDPAFGCGGGGNGGNGCIGTDPSGNGGGGGGYGGGILTIIASSIKYDKDYPPHFIVSGQQGGLNGWISSRAQNGEGGLLIIKCPNYNASPSQWNLYNETFGTHFMPSQNGGHGVVTGNPAKIVIDNTPFSGGMLPEINQNNTGNTASQPSDETNLKYAENANNTPDLSPSKNDAEAGNTIGNNANYARVVQKDGWLYFINFSDGGRIYKMKPDGSKETKVSNKTTCGCINVVGDWIYYISPINDQEHLCKIKTNGTMDQTFDDNAFVMSAAGDWLYYIVMPEDRTAFEGNIYKIKADWAAKTKLTDDDASCINVIGSWIYYIKSDGIYKMKTDGTQKIKITDDQTDIINTDGDWIYYINNGDSDKIYKIKIDGTEKTKLTSESCREINVAGNWIYYKNSNSQICKMTTDGLNPSTVENKKCVHINVAGDYVYFYFSGDYDQQLYRIKTDGTGEQKVK